MLFISSRFSPVNAKNCPIVILLKRLKYSTSYAANRVIGVKWGQTGLKRGQIGSHRIKQGQTRLNGVKLGQTWSAMSKVSYFHAEM